MQAADGTLVLAATDLSNFLACRHRTALDFAAALGRIRPPESRLEPALRLLLERGAAHEQAYVEFLRGQGLTITEIPKDRPAGERVALTLDALKSGKDVIYQGAFAGNGWVGYADVLRKVPCASGTGSSLGPFQYEPYDTKLALETRGGTILQLALYAELLGAVQGVLPERFFVVTPGDPFTVHGYRLADYAAYFRLVRERMLELLTKDPDVLVADGYPEPVEHCDVCRWWERCDTRRRDDDHLSFIAGGGRAQRSELATHGVTTLAAAAAMPVPIQFRPSRGARETYNRIGEQAQVQLQQRLSHQPVFRVVPVQPSRGLCRMPEPTKADLFLDLEGARFVRQGGHDYLFGLGHIDDRSEFIYRSWWSMTPAEEQRAFEELIDVITKAKTSEPKLHIYHFAPYEPTALKRLAGRYATRQEELDNLLRAESFVDLYAVVRQGILAGVESYSIKQLEQYYGYTREMPLRDVAAHRIAVEMALQSHNPDSLLAETLTSVERYNRDDVVSTYQLRDWLERLRTAEIQNGVEVPRPTLEQKERKDATERAAAASALRQELLQGVAPEASEPGHPDHERWLLAYLIDWHHREEKAEWWEFFRLRELPEEDLLDEPKAISGLEHVAELGPFIGKKGKPTGSIVHRYGYPPQELEVTEGDSLRRQDDKPFGEVLALDRLALTIDVKRGKKSGEGHPSAVFSLDVIGTRALQDSVMRFAQRMHQERHDVRCAGADLLYRRTPQLLSGVFAPLPDESASDLAVRIVTDLDRTTLAIQGPPGAGKTHVAARMIRAAVAAGKRVGVTATSHKVIQNLFDAVRDQAGVAREHIRLGRKPKEGEDVPAWVTEFDKNDQALAAIRGGDVHVLGGTAWLWADEDAVDSVDLLLVDEAGQFSLANALAVAPAANSLVLLGDPKQLDQPQKASHPEGVEVSALAHILGDAETMTTDRGIFMPETRRLAPSICAFTSELFYAGRLTSIPALGNQRIVNTGVFDGAGLWWVPVNHDGNRSASVDEVDAVSALVERLVGSTWIAEDGTEHPLTAADIRVVAPYNAQVNRLAERLEPRGVPVGTVDRFQGQTCAVAVYSMTTSRPEDAPRGMEFLYSLNRLNVATSRARCASFVVASPALLEPQCRTPRQMQLANGLCRFVEMSRQR